jgi:hypothetical protein
MGITVFEGYTVGKIERGIPFPDGSEPALSTEQKRMVQLKDGETLALALRPGGFSSENAKQLVRWARQQGIRTELHAIDAGSVRISRIGAVQAFSQAKRRK